MKLINLPKPLILLLATTTFATGLPNPKANFVGKFDCTPSRRGRAPPIRENKATQDRIDAFNFFAEAEDAVYGRKRSHELTSSQTPIQGTLNKYLLNDEANVFASNDPNSLYYLNLSLRSLLNLQDEIEADPQYGYLSPVYRDLVKIREVEKVVIPPEGRKTWEEATKQEMELWHPFGAFRRFGMSDGRARARGCPETRIIVPFGMTVEEVSGLVSAELEKCWEMEVNGEREVCLVQDAVEDLEFLTEGEFTEETRKLCVKATKDWEDVREGEGARYRIGSLEVGRFMIIEDENASEDMTNKLIGGGENLAYYSKLSIHDLSTLQYNIDNDPRNFHLDPVDRHLLKLQELEKIVRPPMGRKTWKEASEEELELWHPLNGFRRATFWEGVEECPATSVEIPFGRSISDIKEKVAKSVKECDEERKRLGKSGGKCLVQDALGDAGLFVELMFESQLERCLEGWDKKLEMEEKEREAANEEYYGGLDLDELLALQKSISEEFENESPARQSQRAVKALEEIVKPPKGRASWEEATRDEWQRWHPFTAARKIGIMDGRMWNCPSTTIIVPFGKTTSEVSRLVTDKTEECEKESAKGAKLYDGKCMYWDAAHELGFKTQGIYGEKERKSCMVSFREWEKDREVMEESGIVEEEYFLDDGEL
ncbi:hypothetical protein B0J14DRAFT_655692 [Halenospora varia]|nr:hypothetical protein B0J14DRAFT_655692 [Halenospora varia]